MIEIHNIYPCHFLIQYVQSTNLCDAIQHWGYLFSTAMSLTIIILQNCLLNRPCTCLEAVIALRKDHHPPDSVINISKMSGAAWAEYPVPSAPYTSIWQGVFGPGQRPKLYSGLSIYPPYRSDYPPIFLSYRRLQN